MFCFNSNLNTNFESGKTWGDKTSRSINFYLVFPCDRRQWEGCLLCIHVCTENEDEAMLYVDGQQSCLATFEYLAYYLHVAVAQ